MKTLKKFIALLISALVCTSLLSCTTTWENGKDADNSVYDDSSLRDYQLQEPTATEFTLAKYCSKNMVVPRDNNIIIWGTAPDSQNGNVVCAEFKGLKGSGVISDGQWQIILQGTLPACCDEGQSIRVYGIDYSVFIDNVLVGDIWVINGQSNAYIPFNQNTDAMSMYKEFFTESANMNFRVLMQPADYLSTKYTLEELDTPQNDVKISWSIPSKSRTPAYTMLGCFFAAKLLEINPQVPIGIINTSVGGVCIKSLVSQETAAKFSESLLGTDDDDSVFGRSRIYNAFIAPITKVHITGMVFFQGEGDAISYSSYADALRYTVADYRKAFNNNFLFINMQLCSYGYTAGIWGCVNYLRFAQAEPAIDKSINDYYIVPTFDYGYNEGDSDMAHSAYKKEVADRAALIAAAKIYNIGDISEVGTPIPDNISYTGKKVTIYYDFVAEGLQTSDGHETPCGFQVLTEGGWILPESVQMTENSVILTSNLKISGVQYAASLFYDSAEATLINSLGTPACPFSVEFD